MHEHTQETQQNNQNDNEDSRWNDSKSLNDQTSFFFQELFTVSWARKLINFIKTRHFPITFHEKINHKLWVKKWTPNYLEKISRTNINSHKAWLKMRAMTTN